MSIGEYISPLIPVIKKQGALRGLTKIGISAIIRVIPL